jgi:hypothetical protein
MGGAFKRGVSQSTLERRSAASSKTTNETTYETERRLTFLLKTG